MEPGISRRMWLVGEPIHAVTYFAPASRAAWEAAGFRGFWRGYFATRAAPFGAVGPAIVTATFYNFAPSMVERALPAVWEMGAPAAALEARASGAVDSLVEILDGALDRDVASRAADLVREALAACSPAGRALYAANAALPWPDEPVAALWHGLTLLREHRGDGHNAALVAAGLDGCEAHILASAVSAGGADEATRQQARGWTDDDWAAAKHRLRDRGVLDERGTVTRPGRDLHADVEARTDGAAMAPWRQLGAERTTELESLLRPWAERVVTSGTVRFPNPMGLPAVSRG